MFLAIRSVVDPTDPSAQELAERELAKNKYHGGETLLERIIRWLSEHLTISIEGIGEDGRISVFILVLAALAVAAIALILIRWWRLRTTSIQPDTQMQPLTLFDDARSSAELFESARLARERNDNDTLVIDLFRGVIRLLDEQGKVSVRPGLTATEASLEGARVLGRRELFLQGAHWFNQVYFSDFHADASAIAAVDELAAFVQGTSALTPHVSTAEVGTL